MLKISGYAVRCNTHVLSAFQLSDITSNEESIRAFRRARQMKGFRFLSSTSETSKRMSIVHFPQIFASYLPPDRYNKNIRMNAQNGSWLLVSDYGAECNCCSQQQWYLLALSLKKVENPLTWFWSRNCYQITIGEDKIARSILFIRRTKYILRTT